MRICVQSVRPGSVFSLDFTDEAAGAGTGRTVRHRMFTHYGVESETRGGRLADLGELEHIVCLGIAALDDRAGHPFLKIKAHVAHDEVAVVGPQVRDFGVDVVVAPEKRC